ncbi:hypothetical protein [Primorskyibacter sp. S87]|uniref:hypothetical protein n=1 Tax=Primorskyibacter sp. S87 TaxID=3415126 RepID=UPI003C79CBF8
MLGLMTGMVPGFRSETMVPLPFGFDWDSGRFPLSITRTGSGFRSGLNPRSLVDPGIWTGVAIHVDGENGDDGNNGFGADGDFSAAKRSIHAAFVAGNATAAPFRVVIKAGEYEESAFTRNGNEEPTQPVAILGWGGPVRYRTGPFEISWTNAGDTYTAPVSAVRRVFRSTQTTAQGIHVELERAADLASCQSTTDSWFADGGTLHINVAQTPGARDLAVIRSFHGARFLNHAQDLYLEDIHCEGGITGALHVDAPASRNVVAVGCSFRYSAPSNVNNPLDAVQLRRTNGLAAFFDCDASGGAEDGWSFHEDGNAGLHVLLENCTGFANGAFAADSCNALTAHDGVRLVDLNGRYGWSRNGTEVHCIQSSQSLLAGTEVTARDVDGTSTAFKCSNQSSMWLQDTVADADGSAENIAIEANGGSVFTRGHSGVNGTVSTSSGGSVSQF